MKSDDTGSCGINHEEFILHFGDKYYTPEIDEFPYGQEYRQLIDGKWEHRACLMHGPISPAAPFSLFQCDFRIKYLDKEDIECMGWMFESKFEHNLWPYEDYRMERKGRVYFLRWRYCYTAPLVRHNISIMMEDVHRSVDVDGKKRKRTMFECTVKNKSELRKLMRMLIDDSEEVKDPGKELWMAYESLRKEEEEKLKRPPVYGKWYTERAWVKKREAEFVQEEKLRKSHAAESFRMTTLDFNKGRAVPVNFDLTQEELKEILNDVSKPVEYSIAVHKPIWDRMIEYIIGPFKDKK